MNLKPLAAALALTAGATLFALPSASAAPTYTNCDVETAALAVRGEEPDVLLAINQLRKDAGIKTLAIDDTLSRPAEWASNDSANRGYSPSNHIDTLGRGIDTRLHQCGLSNSTLAYGEINYWGYNITPNDAMTFWKNSPTHKALMLSTGYTRIGVAVIYKDGHQHWTVTFASNS
ncbi:CAP domain-containing protein [Nocardia sp. NPDC051030]|uniref:CAP domain-containing protein n=1 Tax=Nocardia sp. NPDC051030 TaxID=3155162 RepID=UPI003449A827